MVLIQTNLFDQIIIFHSHLYNNHKGILINV